MKLRKRIMGMIAVCLVVLLLGAVDAGADLHLSDAGKTFIKRHEGCVLTAYWDGNGYSIGYGHHGDDVTEGMVISQAQADAYFESDIVRFERAVNRMAASNGVMLLQRQFDALTDFCYNEGAYVFEIYETTIELYLRDGWTNHSLEDWIYAFCRFDTRVPGLQARHKRQAEFFYGSGSAGTPSTTPSPSPVSSPIPTPSPTPTTSPTPAPVQTPTPSPSPTPSPTPTPSPSPTPSPTPTPSPSPVPSPTPTPCPTPTTSPTPTPVPPPGPAEIPEHGKESTLVLPEQITVIEKRAFAGVNATVIEIPTGVKKIRSEAFADCPNLRMVWFHGMPYSIADDILSGCSNVTVRCAKGSNVAVWAKALGYPVEYSS